MAKGASGGFVRGMKGVLEECEEEIRAHVDGLAADEDHTEGVKFGDGVRGWGAAVAVLGDGGVPEGGGGDGRVDSIASAGSERVHGESQVEGTDDVESPDLPAKSSHQSGLSPLGQTQQSSNKGHHRQPRCDWSVTGFCDGDHLVVPQVLWKAMEEHHRCRTRSGFNSVELQTVHFHIPFIILSKVYVNTNGLLEGFLMQQKKANAST
ncbi:hypothetical protein RHSIM_Rhsim06G0045300 [Rhododendron simsii]|uniref:Uncharacterized protein n=1 Tax=Rhododendron simsii TaxID=118357 RepID=A0A834LLS9_RHOSS|nr:hypothetical protein RHSIM_Rhsim06G0045300 [Rhododendron simsii]